MSHRPAAIWLLTIAFSAHAACAPAPRTLRPLSEAQRARLGTIGVVWARFVPEVAVETSGKALASGFARGAEKGARIGGKIDDDSLLDWVDTPAELLAAVLFAPFLLFIRWVVGTSVGALVGGAAGAADAPRASASEQAKGPVADVVSNLYVQETLHDYLVETARDTTRYTVVAVSDRGPSTADERVDYRSVEGIDTVLEASVLQITVQSKGSEKRPVALVMTAHVRLVRTTDGRVLRTGTVKCVTRKHGLAEWMAADGEALHEEFTRCYKSLAVEIVDDLLAWPRYADANEAAASGRDWSQ